MLATAVRSVMVPVTIPSQPFARSMPKILSGGGGIQAAGLRPAPQAAFPDPRLRHGGTTP